MATPWFCKIDGEEVGPVSGATLKEMVSDGSVERKTLIRRGDSSRWVTAGQVQGLFDRSRDEAKPKSASSSNVKLKRAESLDAPPRPPVPPPVAGPPPPVEAAAAPAAAPPPPSDSQAIPAGVPVGAAVSDSGQIPVGYIPTGQAVTNAGHSAYHEAEHEDPIEARRQKKQMQQVMLVAGMVIVVLALAAGGITYAIVGGGDRDPKIATSDPVEAVEPPAPAANQTETPAEPAPDAEAIAQQQAEQEQADAVDAMLAQMADEKWREISPLKTISLRGMYKLKVTAAWLSNDPTGATALDPAMILAEGSTVAAGLDPAEKEEDAATAEEPAEEPEGNPLAALLATEAATLPDAGSGSDADEPASAAPPSKSGRYVIVRVELTNAGEEPLTYQSWNPLAGEEVAASLIAGDSIELKAIPIKQIPGPGRSGKTVLDSNEEVIDHLVFAAPDRPVGSLKLLMPKQALGRDGTYGFKITADVLQTKYEHQLAEMEKEKANAAEPMPIGTPPAPAANPPAAVAEAAPQPEPPKPLTEAEKLRRERDAFLRSINGAPEEPKPDEEE